MELSYKRISPSVSSDMACHSKDKSSLAIDEVDVNAQDTVPDSQKVGLLRPDRTMPPFILSHDLPRGIVYAIQALLGYVLMLAIMWVSFPSRPNHCRKLNSALSYPFPQELSSCLSDRDRRGSRCWRDTFRKDERPYTGSCCPLMSLILSVGVCIS